jgi:hypothetical protein
MSVAGGEQRGEQSACTGPAEPRRTRPALGPARRPRRQPQQPLQPGVLRTQLRQLSNLTTCARASLSAGRSPSLTKTT